MDLAEAEGISDIDQLNKILQKAVNLRNAIKSQNRIEKTAKYIANHYREYVEPLGYKAFIVAVDREACAMYKEQLDKHLPADYSKVVYSPYQNDPEFMVKHYLSEEEEKRVRKDFADPEKLPKILIVTNKLLTGFDAPILYCMYLDKPMRDHILLQTIARVNRPYEDKEERKKPAGLIIDFIGIFNNLEKALAFDSADIKGIINDIESLKERFVELIDFGRKNILNPLKEIKNQDKKIDWILENFEEERKRKEFYSFYKELSDIYDIISPDDFLRPYLEDMDTLTKIYKIAKEAYDPSIKIDKEFSDKVKELVRNYTNQSEIKATFEIVEINEDTLKKLESKNLSDRQKIFNLNKALNSLREQDGVKEPYLISIAEKAERIMEEYNSSQITTKKGFGRAKKIL